nr:reverse transcriptase domain, reverse transcriptase zinc-binding domain protein [Tanacetum cinerariifolium]
MKSLIGMPNIPSDLNSIVDFLIPLAKMQLARSVIAKLVFAASCYFICQMHNNIMVAGLRDRPPMLATGRYAQWLSRFLRYTDTRPNGDALRKCILEGPYTPSTIIILAVPAIGNSPAVPERTTVETTMNMSLENKAHFESEKEAIYFILTGIRDEIYSTGDACKTSHEM